MIDKDTRLLENAVAVALTRYGNDFYYLKSNKTNIDIDFYIPSIDTAIQVAYSIDDVTTESREVGNLMKFSNKSPNSNLTIVTISDTRTININDKKIEVVSFYDFINKLL